MRGSNLSITEHASSLSGLMVLVTTISGAFLQVSAWARQLDSLPCRRSGMSTTLPLCVSAGPKEAPPSPRGWGFYFVPVQGSAPEPKVMIRLPFALTYFQPSQIGPDDDLIDLGAVRQAVLDTARSLHPGAAIEGGESVFRRVPRQQGVGISWLVGIDRETTTFVSAVTGIGNEVIVHELPEDGSATFVFDE